jgi:hypothetical protein
MTDRIGIGSGYPRAVKLHTMQHGGLFRSPAYGTISTYDYRIAGTELFLTRFVGRTIFQHHFSKLGHRNLLVTQTLRHAAGIPQPTHTRSVRRAGGFVLTA